MSSETEVKRVLSNPDHVILSEALKEALGDTSYSTHHNEPGILVKIKSSKFECSGNLVNLEVYNTTAKVALSLPNFKILHAVFALNGEKVEMEFESYDYKIGGVVTSAHIKKASKENIENFNLKLCLDLK